MVYNKEKANERARKRYQEDDEYRAKVCLRNNEYYHKHKDQWQKAQEKRISKRRAILDKEGLITDCVICGFSKEKKAAIDFHHVDPLNKERDISNFRGISSDEYIKEARKCVCLCANCHRLYHAGDEEIIRKYNEVVKKKGEENENS